MTFTNTGPKLASDYDRVPCSKCGIEVLRSSLYDDRCVDRRSEIRRERAASAAYGAGGGGAGGGGAGGGGAGGGGAGGGGALVAARRRSSGITSSRMTLSTK